MKSAASVPPLMTAPVDKSRIPRRLDLGILASTASRLRPQFLWWPKAKGPKVWSGTVRSPVLYPSGTTEPKMSTAPPTWRWRRASLAKPDLKYWTTVPFTLIFMLSRKYAKGTKFPCFGAVSLQVRWPLQSFLFWRFFWCCTCSNSLSFTGLLAHSSSVIWVIWWILPCI